MDRHALIRLRFAALGAGAAAAVALGLSAPPQAWLTAGRPAKAVPGPATADLRQRDDGHRARQAGATPSAAAPAGMGPALELVRQFALNALLAPLIDDDSPPHWTRTDLIDCEPGTQLRIDGHPLEPGSALPAVPFRVQWTMKGCRAFDDGNVLEGRVEMQVFPDDDQLTAVVDARLLEVVAQDGRAQRMQPAVFGARLGLLPPPSP